MGSCLRRNDGWGAGMTEGAAGMREGGDGSGESDESDGVAEVRHERSGRGAIGAPARCVPPPT